MTSKKPVKTKITKDSNLGELIFKYPKTVEVLIDFGLHCVGCGAAHLDTIEAGARIHGLSDPEIVEMVIRINEVIEYKE
jgi:hybrid cluster-associated redox disulfide protein